MANITVTEVNDALATIIAAEALGRLRSNAVLANLVARDWDAAVASYGQSVQIPVRGALSVNDKSANTAYTLQAPADDKVTVTLNQHREVSFVIEDIAAALARPDYLMGYINDAAIALAEDIDGKIAALYSGLSQSVDATGTAGPLDKADFIEARRKLSVAKAPVTERYAVLHPTAAAEALAIAEFTNRDYRGPAEMSPLVEAGVVLGNFAGFSVIEDQNIVESASKQRNMFFHKDAFALVTRPLPAPMAGAGVVSKVMSENGIGLRVMISYQHTLGGHMCTLDVLYGVAELRDALGVVVLTD